MQNQLRMTGTVLCLLLFFAGDALAQFGPSETKEEKAERLRWEESVRQGYIDKRQAMGDHAFKAYAIATLDHLLAAKHPLHPQFDKRSQQLGTAEYTLRTEPRFFQEVVPMLVEMEATEAVPILAEHIHTFEYLWRTRTTSRLGYGLDARRAAVQNAWFDLTVEHSLGLEEATAELTEMIGRPQALQMKIDRLLAERERHGRDFNNAHFFDWSLDDRDNLFVELTRWRWWIGGAGSGLNPIEQVAEQRAWNIGEWEVDKALEHENIRVRVAAAMAYYIQEVQVPELYNLKAPPPIVGDKEIQTLLGKINQATLVRNRLIAVWRQLLEQRSQLNANIPAQEWEEDYHDFRKRLDQYQESAERNRALLWHLYNLIAFDKPDPALINLCIYSVGYTDGFIHLVRHHERGTITLSDDQINLAARWISNPYIPTDHRERIIDGLIQLDHAPAAKAIAKYYQGLGLLDDKLNPVTQIGINAKKVPFKRQLSLDHVEWIQKHAQ